MKENQVASNAGELFFDNEKGWMRPDEVSKLLGISTSTVYDWKYRGKKRGVPKGLFVKLNRKLFVRTKVLKTWVEDQTKESN